MRSIILSLVGIVCCTMINAQQVDTLAVYFSSNQASLPETSSKEFSLYLQNKYANNFIETIELYGHCDSIGSNRHNDSLALARALFMQGYLKNMYPTVAFTKVQGKGEYEPVNSNSSEEGRQSNRRVVMIIYYKLPALPEKEETMVKQETTTILKKPRSVAEIFNDTAIAVGEHLALPQLQFVGGRHIPLPGVWIVLDQVAATLKDRPKLKIEIQGHICCLAPPSDGLDNDLGTKDLSVQRAKYVYDYLAKKGISKSRMSYKGLGSSRKLYEDESTEFRRQSNRRIEFVIVAK